MKASEKFTILSSLIGLVTAIVSLANSMVNTFKIQQNTKQIEQTSKAVETLQDFCRGKVTTKITNLSQFNVNKVSADILNITGEGTVHGTCYCIALIIHDISTPGRPWTIADLVQVDTTGHWKGTARLDVIPIGGTAEIDARVTDQCSNFLAGATYSFPPEQGARSNIIRIVRVKKIK